MKKSLMNIKKIKYYIYLHIVILIGSMSSIASKAASQQDFLSWNWVVLYGTVIATLGIYAILWQQILKHISLTTAFCNKAVTIIWGMIWGIFLFGETIKPTMIIGAVIVLTGVVLVVSSDR